MRRTAILSLALAFFAVPVTCFGQCALPYSFTNGQTADASQVMANFNALIACLNPGGSTNAIQYNRAVGRG